MPIGLDKGLLVYILGILLVAKHMQRQPQNRLVVASNQRIKCSSIAPLRFPDQIIVFDPLLGACLDLRLRQLAATSSGLRHCFCHRWQ